MGWSLGFFYGDMASSIAWFHHVGLTMGIFGANGIHQLI